MSKAEWRRDSRAGGEASSAEVAAARGWEGDEPRITRMTRHGESVRMADTDG